MEKRLRIYIETSIPSFYHTLRTDTASLAMQHWTREWWAEYGEEFILVTSPLVITELSAGTKEMTQPRIELVETLEMLSIHPDIRQIAQTYVDRLIMPQNASGDALHLAIASFHQVDILLTWNCRHLANANKFDIIRRINRELALPTPELVTPLNFLGIED